MNFPMSLSMISTWFHRWWWFPSSPHMRSAPPDFFRSPCVTAFWRSFSFILKRRPVSPLYYLPQLHGVAYTQSLVMVSSMGGLNRVRYLRSVVKLLKIFPDSLRIACLNTMKIIWNYLQIAGWKNYVFLYFSPINIIWKNTLTNKCILNDSYAYNCFPYWKKGNI